MGRNKNKYVKDKYNQPGFLYSKNSDSQSTLDEWMENKGFEKDIVYSENKDKRWTLKEELANKVAETKDEGSLSVVIEVDSYKPTESKFIAMSDKQPKGGRVNISSVYNSALGKKSKKCQKCNNLEEKENSEGKSCSMIVYCNDFYTKKGITCSCCRQDQVRQRIKFRNEKIKAFSECAYDPHFDESEETVEENTSVVDEQPSLPPISIDIGAIFNEPNNNLRFKPRDPDNGFEFINDATEDRDPSSDFEYVEQDEVMVQSK